jgi:hypothetical protein
MAAKHLSSILVGLMFAGASAFAQTPRSALGAKVRTR